MENETETVFLAWSKCIRHKIKGVSNPAALQRIFWYFLLLPRKSGSMLRAYLVLNCA